MERIDVDGALPKGQRGRYFARASGTAFSARAMEAGTAQIELYDEIGMWGVSAKDFSEQLKGVSGDLVLKINSPGGNVFDGIAMFNELLSYPGKVRVEVVGLAASAASIVAMAGDEIAIAENAFVMIHNAWTFAIGNRHDMIEASTVLGKIDGAIARTYANQCGLGIRTVSQMMDDETWMAGPEAKDKGFATEVMTVADTGAKARFDLSVYAKVPDPLRWAPDAAADPETIRDVERELMRDAGPRSRTQARALMRACKASSEEVMPGAGSADLTRLLESLQRTRAELTPNT